MPRVVSRSRDHPSEHVSRSKAAHGGRLLSRAPSMLNTPVPIGVMAEVSAEGGSVRSEVGPASGSGVRGAGPPCIPPMLPLSPTDSGGECCMVCLVRSVARKRSTCRKALLVALVNPLMFSIKPCVCRLPLRAGVGIRGGVFRCGQHVGRFRFVL